MIRLMAVAFALIVSASAQAAPRAASSAGEHGHASPRGMRCGYAHGQWSVHTYFRPPERRQVCGWDAFSGWPLR